MSLLKSELKIAWLHSQGCDFDDALETYTAEMHRAQGVIKGLEQAAVVLAKFPGLVDQDVQAERFDAATAEHVKANITRMFNALQEAARLAAFEPAKAQGRMEAIQRLVQKTKRDHSTEVQKRDALAQVEAGNEPTTVAVVGQRPNMTLKERRQAEAAAEAEAAKPKRKKTSAARKRVSKKAPNGQNS